MGDFRCSAVRNEFRSSRTAEDCCSTLEKELRCSELFKSISPIGRDFVPLGDTRAIHEISLDREFDLGLSGLNRPIRISEIDPASGEFPEFFVAVPTESETTDGGVGGRGSRQGTVVPRSGECRGEVVLDWENPGKKVTLWRILRHRRGRSHDPLSQ